MPVTTGELSSSAYFRMRCLMTFFTPSSATFEVRDIALPSLRIRAISVLSFEAGTVLAFGWRAEMALPAPMSARICDRITCVTLAPRSFSFRTCLLPARLDDAGDFTVQRQLTESQTANAVFTQERPRTATAPAPVAVAALEFWLLFVFCDFGGCCHVFFLLLLFTASGTAFQSA